MDKAIKDKLEKVKKVIYITETEYLGKKYVQTMKMKKDGIEDLYYEIEDGNIKDIQDKDIITHFKEKFETKKTNIIY